MEEADQLCDRVAIMDHGKLLALDTPAGLKRSVDADTQVRVVADGDPQALAKHLAEFEGVSDARPIDDFVNVTLKGRKGMLPALVDHVEKGGFTLADISSSDPTLETVFIELTGKDLRE
jgi:ABC-2 type transport system ATP-binding protein